jgi:hypothetical protein
VIAPEELRSGVCAFDPAPHGELRVVAETDGVVLEKEGNNASVNDD